MKTCICSVHFAVWPVLFTFFQLAGCRSANDDVLIVRNASVISVDLKYRDTIGSRRPGIFDSARIVCLKTKDSSFFVASVNKVLLYRDKIFILDNRFSNLLSFDRNGAFLRKYGEIGLGPREYKKITDFDIDSSTNRVIAFSSEDRALYYYDAGSGNFIAKRKIGVYGSSIVVLPGSGLLLYKNYASRGEGDNNNLLLLDSNARIVGKYFSFDPKLSGMDWNFTGFLSKTNGEVLSATAFGDTVYKYDNGRIRPYLSIDMNSAYIKENKFNHLKLFSSNKLTDSATSFLRNSFLKNDDFVVLNFQKNRRVFIGIYDLKNKRINVLRKELDPLIYLIQEPMYLTSNDTAVFSLSKERLLAMRKKDPSILATLAPDTRKILDSAGDDSGEYLLFSKIH